MTFLSRKADYALLILAHLHAAEGGSTARAIAERFNLSRAFVANILKELCRKGFVTSTRGVTGGYTLLRPADSVTLAELLDALDDGFKLAVCTGHGEGPPADPCSLEAACPMKGPLAAIHDRLSAVLRGVTLAELFGPRPVHDLLPLLTVRAGRPAPTGAIATP